MKIEKRKEMIMAQTSRLAGSSIDDIRRSFTLASGQKVVNGRLIADRVAPNKIDHDKTHSLILMLDGGASKAARVAEEHLNNGWDIWVVDQRRGFCHYRYAFITIPVFAFNKGPAYIDYYLSHELAHAVAGPAAKHGPLFMAAFKKICDPKNWHYELNYKPSYAKAAGIMEIPDDF